MKETDLQTGFVTSRTDTEGMCNDGNFVYSCCRLLTRVVLPCDVSSWRLRSRPWNNVTFMIICKYPLYYWTYAYFFNIQFSLSNSVVRWTSNISNEWSGYLCLLPYPICMKLHRRNTYFWCRKPALHHSRSTWGEVGLTLAVDVTQSSSLGQWLGQ